MRLKKTLFSNSTIHEADFTETDLNGAILERCDFRNVFSKAG